MNKARWVLGTTVLLLFMVAISGVGLVYSYRTGYKAGVSQTAKQYETLIDGYEQAMQVCAQIAVECGK